MKTWIVADFQLLIIIPLLKMTVVGWHEPSQVLTCHEVYV